MAFYPLPNTISKDDLIQVGAVGVLNAIETYRIEERGSFKTYVSKVIKGKIFHYLRDKANLVKTPRETIANMSKVKEAIDELSENNTRIPTVEEVANYVNLPFDKVEEIMNIELIKNMISLDQSIYTQEGGETLLDRIQDNEESSFEDTYANKKIIEFAINKLPQNDKIAITMYNIDRESRREIAKRLNVSPTQVSRILKKALNKLYVIIQKEMNEKEITI
jgi:RNA polymerase sigma factor (sigma-70 family)